MENSNIRLVYRVKNIVKALILTIKGAVDKVKIRRIA
jgi:hypothetical protein